MKFKPGDTVRCIRDSGSGSYLKDALYVIRYYEPSGYQGEGTIHTECDSVGSRTNGWGANNFEPPGGPW